MIMKTIFFLSVILFIYFQSCKNIDRNERIIGDPELSEIENQQLIDDLVNSQEELYTYPDIISKSSPNLKLVKNHWIKNAILCSQNEEFFLLRKINNSRLVAVSSEEIKNYEYIFRFYDFDVNGIIYHKSILSNTNYSIDNRFNFQIDENFVNYYLLKDSDQVFSYSLIDNSHKRIPKEKLNWQLINDWKNEHRYLSNNQNSEIFIEDVKLILYKNNKLKDTLINQQYDGTWSFRKGTWSEDDSKFYFDNSGAVACIWEINLRHNTLDKIVPDHWATSPVYIKDEDNDAIVYCHNNCVYITRKKEN